MPTIDPTATLADLVTANPSIAPHLDRLGLDYCCGGSRSLADALDQAGHDLAAIVAAIEAPGSPGDDVPWRTMEPVNSSITSKPPITPTFTTRSPGSPHSSGRWALSTAPGTRN